MPRKYKKKDIMSKKTGAPLPSLNIRKIEPCTHLWTAKKKYIVSITVILLLTLIYLFKGLFIVATVNGKPIFRFNVIRQLERQEGQQVLNTFITQELIFDEARNKKINITQQEIDNELKKIETNLSTQGITLEDALAQERMKKTNLYEEIKIQLILQKLVGTVSITDKEIDDYLTSYTEQLTDTIEQVPTRDEVKSTLEQQKLQQKIQDIITTLKEKAKINYFVTY